MQNKLTSVNRWIFRKLSNRLLLWYLREVQRTYRRDNRSYTSANSQDKHGEQLNFMYFACKNSQNDSKVCCPLIGQKITKAFWHQSEARTAATVWNWSGKTLSSGVLHPFLNFSSRHVPPPPPPPFSLYLTPTSCPWVSEDASVDVSVANVSEKTSFPEFCHEVAWVNARLMLPKVLFANNDDLSLLYRAAKSFHFGTDDERVNHLHISGNSYNLVKYTSGIYELKTLSLTELTLLDLHIV